MSEFIPNSFQTPNAFVDELMALLTGEEYKVLSYAARRIFGFQKRQDRISLTQFERGLVAKDGRILSRGTGLSRPTIIKCLANLEAFGLFIRVNPNEKSNEGTEYELQLDPEKVNWKALEDRLSTWESKNKEKMERVRSGGDGKKIVPDSLLQVVNDIYQSTAFTPGGKSHLPQVVNGIYTQNTDLKPDLKTEINAPVFSSGGNGDGNGKNDHGHSEQPIPGQSTCPDQPWLARPRQAHQDKQDGQVRRAADQRTDKFRRTAANKLGDLMDGMIRYSANGRVDISAFPEQVQPVIQLFCDQYGILPPRKQKGGQFALWIQDAWLLLDAGGELTLDALKSLKDKPYEWMKNAQIGRPGTLINAVRSRAGELRLESKNIASPEEEERKRKMIREHVAKRRAEGSTAFGPKPKPTAV